MENDYKSYKYMPLIDNAVCSKTVTLLESFLIYARTTIHNLSIPAINFPSFSIMLYKLYSLWRRPVESAFLGFLRFDNVKI